MSAEVPEKSAPRMLTPSEIVSKLNRIPVFCITTEDGELFAGTTESGVEPFIGWHTDADNAKAVLAAAQGANPGSKLTCMPLGNIVAVINGWADMGGKFKFRIIPSEAALNTYEVARPGALEEAKAAGGWICPVFFCTHLVRKDGLPMFLNPEHVKLAWQESLSGMALTKDTPEDQIPKLELKAATLIDLVHQMRTTVESDWANFIFIGAKASLELAAAVSAGGKEGKAEGRSNPTVIARKQQICAQLNSIPAFTLVSASGAVLAAPDAEGKPFIPWMTDGPHAKKLLASAHAQGQTTVRLATQPLGDMLAIAIGWKVRTD